MKEIGGYFGLEPLMNRPYYPDLIAVNNARNALLYIIKARKVRKLFIPYFLCDSVSNLCLREQIEFAYYHIDRYFRPVFNGDLAADEYLYIVNFYGQISNEEAENYKERFGNVIFDNVQAFFQKPVPGIDTVYSCRKFFGVPDGGYVSTDTYLNVPLPEDVSSERMKHILGRFEGKASDFYADFKKNDALFKELELRSMSALTRNILGAIDYESVRKKREENFEALHQALGAKNALSLIKPIGPYVYPFYCENGMEVKKRLAQESIFVATLWPNVLSMEGTLEKKYAENILPLPCDQRYDLEDMRRVIQEVEVCIG